MDGVEELGDAAGEAEARGWGACVVFGCDEEVLFPFCPGVAAADCQGTVHGFLPWFWGRAGGERGAGVGVAEALEERAVRGVVVPYGEFEDDGAEDEEDFGGIGVGEVGL